MLRLVAAVSIGVLACGGGKESGKQAAGDLYRCEPPRSGKLEVELARGATAAELAQWWMALSCNRVVIPRRVRSRALPEAVSEAVDVGDGYRVFKQQLATIGLTAVTEDGVTVIIDRPPDAPGDGPGLAVAPAATPASRVEPPPRDEPGDAELGPDGAGADGGEGIRKTGEHAYRIERARADALRKDEAALRAVRVVPYVKDGEQVGLKLFAIRPSAVWAQLGLKNGDVVAAVNGRSLGSMDETIDMLEALENKRRFEIEIVRRGKPVTLVWTVK